MCQFFARNTFFGQPECDDHQHTSNWQKIEEFFSFSYNLHDYKQIVRTKARKRLGRKCVSCVTALKSELVAEFELLRVAKLKFSAHTLTLLAKNLIEENTKASYNKMMRLENIQNYFRI